MVGQFIHNADDDKYEEHTHIFRLFGWNIWASYYHDGFGWFRFLGYGLSYKDTTRYALLFSERYGYTKALNIGRWRISILKTM